MQRFHRICNSQLSYTPTSIKVLLKNNGVEATFPKILTMALMVADEPDISFEELRATPFSLSKNSGKVPSFKP